MIDRLLRSSLFQDTAKLVSGTAGARLVQLLALPFVTRLYSPEDFQLVAVFMAIVSTIAVATCLRIEIAIPLAKNDDDAINLLALSLLFAMSLSTIMLTAVYIEKERIANFIGLPGISPYLSLMSLGVFLTAFYNALQFWATRRRRFNSIASTRVSQAVIGTSTTLFLGWAGFTPIGLLIGSILTLGAGGISLAVQTLRYDGMRLCAINKPRLRDTLRKYRRYPIFSTPEALANVASIQIPILIIANYSRGEAGHLFLAMQVIAVPMTLVGASVGQVYTSRAAEELRKGTLSRFTRSMMLRLFAVGVGPIALAALLAPILFPMIFGPQWERAGQIVSWIAPWMLIQLAVSPVSMGLHVIGRQKDALALQVFAMSLRLGMVLAGVAFCQERLIEIYAISGLAFYLIYAWRVDVSLRSI